MSQFRIALSIGSLAACVAISACQDGGRSNSADPPSDEEAAQTEPVPRALCGPGSLPETGLQGQVSLEDRLSGRSLMGYRCNLEKVGQYQGEGAGWQFDWYDNCAYVGTANNAGKVNLGTMVLDVSDPTQPVPTAYLATPAMIDPWESLQANRARGLLAGAYGAGGGGGPELDIYDLTGDCRQPQLLATGIISGTLGHEGGFSPDGRTWYGGNGARGPVGFHAVDLDDPSAPTALFHYPGQFHGLAVNDEGTRVYQSHLANGLMIFDTSQIQARAPAAQAFPISTLNWEDGTLAQMSEYVTIGGTPYLIFVDEAGRGAARIIDISNELLPRVVSSLKLEVHQPEHVGLDQEDGGSTLFVYDGHYCRADRRHEPTVVGCSYFESGLRVFDIRDPLNPVEIAYFNPPAVPEAGPGSQNGGGTADHCTANLRFVPERAELWSSCQDNGFLVLRFTNGTWPFVSQ